MRVELHSPIQSASRSSLVARFPSVRFEPASAGLPLTAERWHADDFEFWAFDRSLDDALACDEPVRIVGEIATEVLIRAQRLAPRRTAASSVPWFDRVLAFHRALHDVTKPLVRADLDHAVDAWQWAVYLDPDAPAAVQLATLLHDVERLVTEADARIEQHATDYQAFKDAHARAGARLAGELFTRAGVPAAIAREAVELIAVHERATEDRAIRAVNDADALSFFSLNSPGYLAYFGPAQTAAKVAYTLARMSARARGELAAVRMPRLVRSMIEHGAHRA